MDPGGESTSGSLTTLRDHELGYPLADLRLSRERGPAWWRRRRTHRAVAGASLAVLAASVIVYGELTTPDTLVVTLPGPTPGPSVSVEASSVPRGAAPSPTGAASARSSAAATSATPTAAKPSRVAAMTGPTASGKAVVPRATKGAAVAVPSIVVSKPPLSSAGGRAVTMYGKPASGLPWHSGMWVGGSIGTTGITSAGTWRGRPMDFATTYPRYATWEDIVSSTDAITDFTGYKGRLSYGLPLLPTDRKGQWTDVTSGAHDAVFQGIARQLVASGHGDAAIRMGPEANGYWFPWSVDADNAAQFTAAYRHIVAVMRPIAPKLTYWLDLNCGTQMQGTTDRKAAFTLMWPGNDVVDGLSMDMYNAYKMAATDDASWQVSLAPSYAPGLADGAAFARSKGIGLSLPEWGLHDVQGPGDSPFFLQKMFEFFVKNKDILVYENYFNEPDPYIANALYGSTNNPNSTKAYLTLWGKGR